MELNGEHVNWASEVIESFYDEFGRCGTTRDVMATLIAALLFVADEEISLHYLSPDWEGIADAAILKLYNREEYQEDEYWEEVAEQEE